MYRSSPSCIHPLRLKVLCADGSFDTILLFCLFCRALAPVPAFASFKSSEAGRLSWILLFCELKVCSWQSPALLPTCICNHLETHNCPRICRLEQHHSLCCHSFAGFFIGVCLSLPSLHSPIIQASLRYSRFRFLSVLEL